MALTAETKAGIAELLHERQDEITKRWLASVQQGVRGRLTEAETMRDLSELRAALLTALRSDGPLGLA